MIISRLKRIQGSLVAAAIGDALGMPYEIMKSEEILASTEGNGVTGFDSLYPDRDSRKIKDMREAEFGDTTDDTQLSMVVLESLVAKGKFDLKDLAKRHAVALKNSRFGWGKTTEMSVRELGEYFETEGKSGRRWDKPAEKGEAKGTGNGVAMKVAPLALFQVMRDEYYVYAHHQVMQLGNQTHHDRRASHAACALAEVIRNTVNRQSYLCHAFEGRENSSSINDLADTVRSLEAHYPSFMGKPRVSEQIRRMTDLDLFYDPIRMRNEIGTSCFAVESVPYSIGVAFRNYSDLRAGILEAVNAGGDTDTNAAMVGAIIGASVGIDGIPEEWLNFRPEFKQIAEAAERLFIAGTLFNKD